jgi:hypothetical protein
MKLRRKLLGIAATTALMFGASPAHAIPVEIGFAIDSSGSIGGANFATQRTIYATALSDPTILPQDGTIAVGIVRFANSPTTIFPVTVIDSTTIVSLTAAITGMVFTGGGTNIGAAIDLLRTDIIGNAIVSDRQVIDVSTDGIGALGTSVAGSLAAGIDQINCLGIGAGANCDFIAGTGAFSITVAGFADLEQALRTKIVMEIGGVPADLAPIPEPTTLLLFGTTMAGLGLAARWRRRRQQKLAALPLTESAD